MVRNMDVNEMNLSLNGCGYLGIYHVGVCSCIKKYYPQVLMNKISGGSVGALVACAFMCDVPLSICVKYFFDVSMKVRNGILGPMSPDLNIMRLLSDYMDLMLPPDAHQRCDGRLNISVTRFENGQNVLLNRFNSREELLTALMCSCFIPVYCGYEPPMFHGVAYVDAALSNNSPWLNENTVTVVPFSGNSDICPENDGLYLKSFTLSNTSIGLTAKNMYMMFRVLFPGSPDTQKEFCQKGYNDALRFLRDNDLVPCPGCVSGKKSGHSKCKPIEQTLPKEMIDEFESSIEEYRKNLSYRIFQYRSMKVLYYLNIPSIVTAKVAYVAMSTILQKVQSKAGSCVDDIWSLFLKILKEGLYGPTGRFKRLAGKQTTQYEKNGVYKNCKSSSENGCRSVVCDEISFRESNDIGATDVQIDVPENNSISLLCNSCTIPTSSNKSCKLDLHFSQPKSVSNTLT